MEIEKKYLAIGGAVLIVGVLYLRHSSASAAQAAPADTSGIGSPSVMYMPSGAGVGGGSSTSTTPVSTPSLSDILGGTSSSGSSLVDALRSLVSTQSSASDNSIVKSIVDNATALGNGLTPGSVTVSHTTTGTTATLAATPAPVVTPVPKTSADLIAWYNSNGGTPDVVSGKVNFATLYTQANSMGLSASQVADAFTTYRSQNHIATATEPAISAQDVIDAAKNVGVTLH
jgi:hypothetical protein